MTLRLRVAGSAWFRGILEDASQLVFANRHGQINGCAK